METPITTSISREAIRDFVSNTIIPNALQFDLEQSIPEEVFRQLAEMGILGCQIPAEYGGLELDNQTLLMVHEELGRGYCSLQNYITVIGMFCKPLIKFGTVSQKKEWLPLIAKGAIIPAIAITEPNIGSDIKEMETSALPKGDFFVLNGIKKYITLAQIADVFMVAARCEGRGVVFLIEKDTPGFEIRPINDLLGLRANRLGELHFNNCVIPTQNLVGAIGKGLTHVISYALDEGRFTTACGCVGLGQACLDEALNYATSRKQFKLLLKDHQLIRKMLTEMIVQVEASRKLCESAASARDEKDPSAINKSLIAKYYASKMATLAANYAVQIRGASGCTVESPAQRYYRDAKIMEIIEGASQMYELYIPQSFTNTI